jgi:dCMP deaminase
MEAKKLNKYDKAYLRIATEWGALFIVSKKVGAIIVKDRMITLMDTMVLLLDLKAAKTRRLNKWDVLHAEANAILKVARSTQSCEGATLYITLSPCKVKLIHQSGIKE